MQFHFIDNIIVRERIEIQHVRSKLAEYLWKNLRRVCGIRVYKQHWNFNPALVFNLLYRISQSHRMQWTKL